MDDEPQNLRVFKFSFRRHYDVVTCTSAEEALNRLREEKFHLVVTDQKMPGMTGTQFLQTIKPLYPDVITLIITGFSDINDIQDAINKCGIYSYVTKPWEAGELKLTLDKAIEVCALKNEKEKLIEELFEATTKLEEKVEERTQEINTVNTKLLDSINYAMTIQNSILSNKQVIETNFEDSFVYYLPKDIVSGDFYYCRRINNKLVIAALDCTGHGVPGALLTILGFTSLESIIVDNGFDNSEQIIKLLNQKIYSYLDQKRSNYQKDGMDGSILVLDLEEQTATFSVANGEVYYVQNGNLESYKGERFSIGNREAVDEISSLTVPLSELSEIYLLSDGFKDLLNESSTKKYSNNQLKSVLSEIHHLPMQDQMKRLDDEKVNWQGADSSQNDDIMVIGLKV